MDLKDIKPSPSIKYWCEEHGSWCVVLGFCQWDGACIFIELDDGEDTTGEYRTTESSKLFSDPISALMDRQELVAFNHSRTLKIEGWINEDRYHDIRPEYTWAKNEVQDMYGEIAYDYNKEVAQKVADAVADAIESCESDIEISESVGDVEIVLNISCAYDEGGMHYAGCEACSPGLGNHVIDAIGIHKSGDKHQYQVCQECLYNYEYGSE